jgi:hypothetical protein
MLAGKHALFFFAPSLSGVHKEVMRLANEASVTVGHADHKGGMCQTGYGHHNLPQIFSATPFDLVRVPTALLTEPSHPVDK